MIRVCIVEDEEAGIELITEFLKAEDGYLLVGTARNGKEAVSLLNSEKPDLVFLDVQMPVMTGFEVLTELEEIPKIIFSTAYDQYALKAFEVHAVDCLLKPYTKERFKMALEKSQGNEGLKPLAEELLQKQSSLPSRILVQSGQKLISVQLSDIIRVEADGNYSALYTSRGKFLSNFGISKLEEKLDPETFIRVHRSAIINIEYLKEVNRLGNSYDVLLQNGDLVRVSRGYQQNLKRFFY